MKLLDQLVEERAEISEAQEGIVVRAADEARDLSESEDTNLKDLATRATALDERITELRDVQVANLEAAKLRAEVERLRGELDKRDRVIEVQGKVSALLEELSKSADTDRRSTR